MKTLQKTLAAAVLGGMVLGASGASAETLAGVEVSAEEAAALGHEIDYVLCVWRDLPAYDQADNKDGLPDPLAVCRAEMESEVVAGGKTVRQHDAILANLVARVGEQTYFNMIVNLSKEAPRKFAL